MGSKIFNADELFDQIEFVVDGKKYVIGTITERTYMEFLSITFDGEQRIIRKVAEIQRLAEGVDPGADVAVAIDEVEGSIADAQLSCLTGLGAEAFAGWDVRKKKRTCQWLFDQVQAQMRPGQDPTGGADQASPGSSPASLG